jgi:hypothetical protein
MRQHLRRTLCTPRPRRRTAHDERHRRPPPAQNARSRGCSPSADRQLWRGGSVVTTTASLEPIVGRLVRMQPPCECVCAGSFHLLVAELSIHSRGDEARRSSGGVEPFLEDDAAPTAVLLVFEGERHRARLPALARYCEIRSRAERAARVSQNARPRPSPLAYLISPGLLRSRACRRPAFRGYPRGPLRRALWDARSGRSHASSTATDR